MVTNEWMTHVNPHITHNFSNRSDEGLTLEMSAFNSLRWPIYVINSVDNTELKVLSTLLHSWKVTPRKSKKKKCIRAPSFIPACFKNLSVIIRLNLTTDLLIPVTSVSWWARREYGLGVRPLNLPLKSCLIHWRYCRLYKHLSKLIVSSLKSAINLYGSVTRYKQATFN